MYYNGQGVPQDYAKAAQWFQKAADQGDAYAQCNLGGMYAAGQGVPQNYAEANQWLKRSAAQGNENAREALRILGQN
jgi:TPR repeat protein